jgi:hypothetical protein
MRAAFGFFIGALFALATSAHAQAYKTPRNALGQPDLEGLWSSNSLTRLERPNVYPSVVITEEQARSVRPPPIIPPDDVGQDDTETYDAEGLALARVGNEIRTAWVVDPPDGRLPFTAAGRALAQGEPMLDGPEQRTNQERCLLMPSEGPPMTNGLYNNNLQIVQTKDHLVFVMEMIHDVRVIPIRRGSHGSVSRWMGDSVGHWEGDTFVIETTRLQPSQAQRSYPLGRLYVSPDAVVTERLRRISATQILYSYSVADRANYTQTWRGEMPLNATKGPMYEFACHEGNYSLPNILAGARAQERAARAVAATADQRPAR